ncbi:putative inactive lipase [Starkeya nomas]|uniref:Putative inactive lipase n=1 Tax=Starkeya nomas TaxID=2666134 RepID=A0A5S9PWQ3_9HYPH|nr:lipase family protein [Starkeya nomas]CAA0109082.1 putative inactive lipase [Starkeya nomas]
MTSGIHATIGVASPVMAYLRDRAVPALCGGALLLSSWSGAVHAADPADFYAVPEASLAGRPGTLIRAEPVPAPAGAAVAYRILYRSRGADGRPVAVSGVVAAPPEGTAREPVVTWGHGTSGIAPGCAPSRFPRHAFESIGGLHDLLADGDIVVATDYQGLGAGHVHPYLVGASEAHAMIDAVRAARQLPGLRAGRRFASWGFSEGGQASLFTGALARSYAPELTFEGAAAVSAPTELGRLLRNDIGTPAGEVVASFAAWSWSHAYHVPLGEVVQPQALPALEHIATLCSLDPFQRIAVGLSTLAYGGAGPLRPDATGHADWSRLIAANSLPTPRGVPVFLAQGDGDDLVQPSTTRDYARRLCRDGVALDYREIPFASHGGAEMDSAAAASGWLAARLAGARPPSDCAQLAGGATSGDGPAGRR